MKLISSLIFCVALSACATDYAARLSEPNFGTVSLKFGEENVDAALLMNGVYASKQLNGAITPLAGFCASDYRCLQQPQLWSSGWAP
jgi:hypothetical protein